MITDTTEKRFESDIEAFFISPAGGYTKGSDKYDPKLGVYQNTLVEFVKATQPKAWKKFLLQNAVDPERKFCVAFNNATSTDGIISVLRHGFKHHGVAFRVCYFRPESDLNETAWEQYRSNTVECYRQWFYSDQHHKSVDMVLVLNGIPVFAFELKNQFTNQTTEDAMVQWMENRDPHELCFQFNKRVIGFFCVDHQDVQMTTKLEGKKTTFRPFNQGSNGPGVDGGAGNPVYSEGYGTHYLWEEVFQKDSMMDIIQKFVHLQKKDGKEAIIFPRYHQLDVVRKLVSDVRANGAGHNYLIQHSAGSGKSNSIAWTVYRLASLFDAGNKPIFSSVIVVTDRTVLDAQLQETISSFEHTLGTVTTIDDKKTSKDLRDAINSGDRIIVSTLQKFPVIYQEVDKVKGRNFAVIVDEAHSSQTGSSALKLKVALADTSKALAEYAELEDEEIEKIDPEDKLVQDIIQHGKHENLSYFAFTATPKDKTLTLFGTEEVGGLFHPFHVYSMRQAIEEHYILDVLQNYMTYDTCFKIAKTIKDNPEVPSSKAAKVIRKFEELHPYNISQKSQIIVETFRETTRHKIGGKGKMMVVTSSRLAAVRYYHEIKKYIEEHQYDDVDILAAFSGAIEDGGEEWTESKINVRADGTHISESQTKKEFHNNFNVLIVAEKYQTGFDEPLLHTMIVDKKLKSVKAVQTLSRLNRVYPGKEDTFVLDFINKAEDIKNAFQPFYQQTVMDGEPNIDLIYETQKNLHSFGVFSETDIDAFCKVYYSKAAQGTSGQGKLGGALKPAQIKYNALEDDQRYQFRRELRSFIRWYGFVSQVIRMFDKDMQKEFVFCSYLLHYIPADQTKMMDLEGKLKLEYYKLQDTFKGAIELAKEDGLYKPSAGKGVAGKDPSEPLDEVIAKINERYKGALGPGDRVLVGDLLQKLINDKKLMKMARTTDFNIFKESSFSKTFNDVAQDSFVESRESYTSLFQDKEKYKVIMDAVCEMFFRLARMK